MEKYPKNGSCRNICMTTLISQTAEYALRAVVFLAEQGTTPCTIGPIATATKVPAGYLSKVMQSLVRGNVVKSQRGLGGGFQLARSAEEITIYDVVNAVDPIQRITECPLHLDAHRYELCALHRRLDDLTAHVEQTFRESRIADLLKKPIFFAATSEDGTGARHPLPMHNPPKNKQ